MSENFTTNIDFGNENENSEGERRDTGRKDNQIATSTPSKDRSKRRKTTTGFLGLKKLNFASQWTNERTFLLIDLWRDEEALYDFNHRDYNNKIERSNAVQRIVSSLANNEGFFSTEEVLVKMNCLRSYYANRRRVSVDSGSSPITWRYYSKLSFLSDKVSMRPPRNGGDVKHDDYTDPISESNIHQAGKETFAMESDNSTASIQTTEREPRKTPVNKEINYGDAPAGTSNSSSIKSEAFVTDVPKKNSLTSSDDDLFCEILRRQLQKIPEGLSKDLLKSDLYRSTVNITNTFRCYSSDHTVCPE